jgi:hypothetical protein
MTTLFLSILTLVLANYPANAKTADVKTYGNAVVSTTDMGAQTPLHVAKITYASAVGIEEFSLLAALHMYSVCKNKNLLFGPNDMPTNVTKLSEGVVQFKCSNDPKLQEGRKTASKTEFLTGACPIIEKDKKYLIDLCNELQKK